MYAGVLHHPAIRNTCHSGRPAFFLFLLHLFLRFSGLLAPRHLQFRSFRHLISLYIYQTRGLGLVPLNYSVPVLVAAVCLISFASLAFNNPLYF